jgi:hypothetical protein
MAVRTRRPLRYRDGDFGILLPSLEAVENAVEAVVVVGTGTVRPAGIEKVVTAVLPTDGAAAPGVVARVDEDVGGVDGPEAVGQVQIVGGSSLGLYGLQQAVEEQ